MPGKKKARQEENPEASPAAMLAQLQAEMRLMQQRMQQKDDELAALKGAPPVIAAAPGAEPQVQQLPPAWDDVGKVKGAIRPGGLPSLQRTIQGSKWWSALGGKTDYVARTGFLTVKPGVEGGDPVVARNFIIVSNRPISAAIAGHAPQYVPVRVQTNNAYVDIAHLTRGTNQQEMIMKVLNWISATAGIPPDCVVSMQSREPFEGDSFTLSLAAALMGMPTMYYTGIVGPTGDVRAVDHFNLKFNFINMDPSTKGRLVCPMGNLERMDYRDAFVDVRHNVQAQSPFVGKLGVSLTNIADMSWVLPMYEWATAAVTTGGMTPDEQRAKSKALNELKELTPSQLKTITQPIEFTMSLTKPGDKLPTKRTFTEDVPLLDAEWWSQMSKTPGFSPDWAPVIRKQLANRNPEGLVGVAKQVLMLRKGIEFRKAYPKAAKKRAADPFNFEPVATVARANRGGGFASQFLMKSANVPPPQEDELEEEDEPGYEFEL